MPPSRLFLILVFSAASLWAQSVGIPNGNAGVKVGTIPIKTPDETDWSDLLSKVTLSPSSAAAVGQPVPDAGAVALTKANQAKDYYTKYPASAKAKEARKIEGLSLIDAAESGDAAARDRMEATVQAFRGDSSVPAYDRAVVAGTYEFRRVAKRATSFTALTTEHEAVARGLIREFPTAPQGYISLLWQASGHDSASARRMAMEVVNAASAPPAVIQSAQRLVTRLDLVGQSVETVFAGYSLDPKGKAGWPAGQAGLIYFWASANGGSLAFADYLAGRNLAKVNVVGVCLDADSGAAAAIARTHPLPGQLIYAPQGMSGALAAQLGADSTPLLYLVDKNGRFTDVLGLTDLETKLAALGL